MNTLTIDRPIVIVGPHRSGTTMLYRILGSHPDAGYLNHANHRFPGSPGVARFLTLVGMGDEPREAQRFWDRFWDGGDDTMGPDDATPDVAEWVRTRVARVLALRDATRFLAKYPRLSLRLPWLDAIFPDAIFLHMVRDWRAVLSSTVERKVKRTQREGGWFGVRIPGFREMADLPPEISAGRIYRIVTRELERQAPRFPGRFFRASYEEICADPVGAVRRLCENCGLPWSPEFEAKIPTGLKSANFKWKARLSAEDIDRVRSEDPDLFARYEFD